MTVFQSPSSLSKRKRESPLPVYQPLYLNKGQSVCAQRVSASSDHPSGFRFSIFPSRLEQDALSNFILRLPREIRSMIYANLFHMFKSYSSSHVCAAKAPLEGDVYLYDTGGWRSVSDFRGEMINSQTVLELDAAPWTYQNISHFFNRTPARHVRSLHPQIFDECVHDICMKAGKVKLSMQYRNHKPAHKYDKFLFDSFARNARDLNVTIGYHCTLSKQSRKSVSSQDSSHEQDTRLAAIKHLEEVLEDGCRLENLTIYLNFDVPHPIDTRPSATEDWVQVEVSKLAKFGCDINLCIFHRCCERQSILDCAYPARQHGFSYCSTYKQGAGWGLWTKHKMTFYEAAALDRC
ncbi:uncharacterized protein PV09_06205 [Verruconis gallopava]|uniref:Uncharacterized protein n=1 Tax=Verruconis gallopava TaxID=253628 RepID=A0A0D2A725_9PEZI|nr:uncharacterized protein PV09_06205 [Verruconis gallopava]KIW02385.1 hypothetical protein PV09_06205 [Verruconis gallopava]